MKNAAAAAATFIILLVSSVVGQNHSLLDDGGGDNQEHHGRRDQRSSHQKEIEITQQVITITNDCLAVGGFAFEKLANHLGAIGAVGSLAKDALEIFGKKDPVLKKLDELENKIDKLSRQMSGQFDDLKAFMSEHHFYAEIAQTASTLTKFLQDTLRHPGRDSVGLFRAATLRNPPLESGYKLLSLLEIDSTNPLKMAMRADRLKKTATFNKWVKIIERVLGQFLFLETFVNGMFYKSNMYGPNQLKRRIHELNKKMLHWRNEYKSSYWPNAVRQLVEEVQDNNKNVGNERKAAILEEHLNSILTDDSFYIIVYNDVGGYDEHSYYGNINQAIYSYRRGECNVVIYRSLHWNHVDRSELDKISHEVEACRRGAIPKYHKDVPRELFEKRFHNVGFVGMIRKKGNHVYVKSAKSYNNRPYGPGWWITAQSREIIPGRYPYWDTVNFILVVGYK